MPNNAIEAGVLSPEQEQLLFQDMCLYYAPLHDQATIEVEASEAVGRVKGYVRRFQVNCTGLDTPEIYRQLAPCFSMAVAKDRIDARALKTASLTALYLASKIEEGRIKIRDRRD